MKRDYFIGGIATIVVLALLLPATAFGVGYALKVRRQPPQPQRPQQPQIVNVINNHQVGDAVHPENDPAQPLLNENGHQAYGANLANPVAAENPAVVNNRLPQVRKSKGIRSVNHEH